MGVIDMSGTRLDPEAIEATAQAHALIEQELDEAAQRLIRKLLDQPLPVVGHAIYYMRHDFLFNGATTDRAIQRAVAAARAGDFAQ